MFETVIKNGTIVDPEKKRLTVANLGIRDGKIGEITREAIVGERILDATGKIVMPGVIDIHTHVEGNRDCAECMAAMGVTTVYNGNCGISPAGDFGEFISKYEKEGFLINQLEQVGHSSLREAVGIYDRYRAASKDELKKMEALCESAFALGAWGLSFGLEYVPGSSFEEVLALSKIAARLNKLISIHIRSDFYSGLGALKEAINITRITGAAVQISHLVYQFGFGMAAEALSVIDSALREGLDISVDSGVYTSFATTIGSAVFDEGCIEKWGCGYDSIVPCTGKYRGERLTKEKFLEFRRDSPNGTAIALIGKEHEIFEILEKPYVMLSSDSGTMYDSGKPGHPQDAGTVPRFFRTMVREQNRISLIDAVRRCTFLPAERLGLRSKGRIEEGADADILIFDIDKIAEKSQFPCDGDTFTRPEGIGHVLVNGQVVVEGKNVLPVNPGKIIRGTVDRWHW